MEHWVNIEEEVVQVRTEVVINKADPSGNLPPYSSSISSEIVPQMIKKTVQLMNAKIQGLPPLLPEPCIFKVHKGLRKVNEEAYTPILVSIGPYHHGNRNLNAMEEHKLRYLHSLLQRSTVNNNIEPYLLLMEKLADRAQAYYANPIYLERDEFVEMLLLDACFIIEFLRKRFLEELRDKDDPIFRSSWMQMQISRDLILLENQLPFFVLSELFDITINPDSEYLPLMMIAIAPISEMLPAKDSVIETIAQLVMKKPASESKHFLDLAHNIYLPLFGKGKDSNSNRTTKPNSSGHVICTRMSSVTELQDAGISFKVDDSDDVSIFDISFDQSRMKIPKFKVTDSTEIFLRNIVAYEQHSSTVEPKYFTDYRSIMDSLINTEKDVNALRLHGIMENWLGDDEEVAHMFNKLGDGVLINTSTFYYSHVCQKVKDYCGKPWNRAKAKLRRNYFHNPWASISTAAAAVLLLLTLTQTVVALIDLLA